MLFIVRDYVVLVIDEGMSMEHCWHDSDMGKLKYSEKTYPSATLWTTTAVFTDWVSDLVLCFVSLAVHDTAQHCVR